MTGRSRFVFISAIALALCVVATAAVFLLNPSSGGRSAGDVAVLVIAVLLAIASVVAVYIMKVRKSSPEKLLSDEYYAEYELVKDFIALSQLPSTAKSDVANDVLEMLIQAQKSGKKPGEVIGDPEAFVKDIVATFASPSKLWLLTFLESWMYLIVFIVLTSLAIWIESPGQSLFETEVPYFMSVLFVLVSFVLIPIAKALTATKKLWAFLLPLGFGLIYIAIAELMRRNLYEIPWVSAFLDGSGRLIPSSLALVCYLLSVPFSFMLKSYLRDMMLRGNRKQ